jgi:hypothetical protein
LAARASSWRRVGGRAGVAVSFIVSGLLCGAIR